MSFRWEARRSLLGAEEDARIFSTRQLEILSQNNKTWTKEKRAHHILLESKNFKNPRFPVL